MGSWSICKRNSDCYTVRDGTRPNNRGFSRSRGGRPDLHGKIIRGGNFSSRARSSPMEKGEAIVPRDRVCYRSNVRTAILSLSLSLFLFPIFIFIFIYFLFFCSTLSRSLCIVRFPVSPAPAPRILFCSTLAVRSFLRKFFSYFCRSISRRQDFTDS